jgi:hypothetical protein
MDFYGLPDQQDMQAVQEHSAAIRALYGKHNLPILGCDNMLVALRNFSFLQDVEFVTAVRDRATGEGGQNDVDVNKIWRLHTYTWCCRNALAIDGDLVECGIHMGLYSGVMLALVDLVAAGKKIVMYDTFSGLDERFSTSRERRQTEDVYQIENWEQSVRNSFTAWPHAEIIMGAVPDALEGTAPDQVAFLHLDMNAAEAEVAALEFFQSRLTPGAQILLDDYGRIENLEIFTAMKDWFGERNLPILELPTGQGLVTWRA